MFDLHWADEAEPASTVSITRHSTSRRTEEATNYNVVISNNILQQYQLKIILIFDNFYTQNYKHPIHGLCVNRWTRTWEIKLRPLF